MEGSGELICLNCNMAFHSAGLLDKHKAKFCIGTDLKEPVSVRRERTGLNQTPRAAVRNKPPAKPRTPDLITLREQRNQQVGERESAQEKPTEKTDLNKLTEEFQKLRMSVEESLPRRQREVSEDQGSLRPRADEQKALELFKNHEQRLAEIRAHQQQLEKQREEIELRLAELAGRDRTTHLEEVLQELRYQEKRNEEVLHQLSSHISSIKGFNAYEAPSNPPEDKKTQHITFDLISSVDGPLSAQIRSLRLAYMQSGGSDPEVLAHMHDLQAEALTLEQTRTRADHKTKGRRMKSPHRVMDPEVLAVEQENQKLEEEIFRIQLARQRHKGDHGLYDVQKDHIHQMAGLQAEITFLRREIEKGRERRPPPPPALFPGPSLALTHSLETLLPAPYDPTAGFVIFYDLVMGIEYTLRSVRLLAGLFCNGQKLGQTTTMPPVQCQSAGALCPPSTQSPGNFVTLAIKQPVPRIQPSPYLSLVVEIQGSGGLDVHSHEIEEFVSLGWTKLELFDQQNQIHSGHWRLPFHSLPIQASLNPAQINSVPQLGNMELYLRVVNARDADVQTLAKIDINTTSQYKNPPMVVSNTLTDLRPHEQYHSLLPPPLPSSPPQTDHVGPPPNKESNQRSE